MVIFEFTNILSLSNDDISNAIIQTEKELFDLRFKKATRQSFKSHEIKQKRHQLVYYKTILTSRFKNKAKKCFNKID